MHSDMDNVTLRKVQLVQLEIAKEIDRICRENDIAYFLAGGTLLGAIRHKGFIPWDDDLDVGMLRTEYEKFLEIAPEKLSPRYKMLDWNSDPNYPHPMGKIIKRGTVYREGKRHDDAEQGIWVDIFPYDNALDFDKSFKRRGFHLKVLRGLIRAKSHYQTWYSDDGIILSKYIKNLPFRILAVFFKKDRLIRKYEIISKLDENKDNKFVYENGTEDYDKWCFPKTIFTTFVNSEFESYPFSIPKDYDKYLTTAYGDYKKLPPEEERENRHQIVEVAFGEQDCSCEDQP